MSVLTLRKGKNDIVQTWDGEKYDYIRRDLAIKAEKAGELQITENLQASQLKRKEDFGLPGVPKTKAKPKKKRTYKTREMKAET